jgi:hypothetical protein
MFTGSAWIEVVYKVDDRINSLSIVNRAGESETEGVYGMMAANSC